MSVVVALANFGRGSARDVWNSMRSVEQGLPHDAILAAVEVAEGDRGYDDHAILDAVFDGWGMTFPKSREVLLTGPRFKWSRISKWSKRAVKGSPGKTPPREVEEAVYARKNDRQVAVIIGHFPTNVRNGGGKWRAFIGPGYYRMRRMIKRRVKVNLRADNDVVVLVDANDRNFPPVHRREVVLHRQGPDHMRAVAAPGRVAKVLRRGEIDLTIEAMHACLWADVRFEKE